VLLRHQNRINRAKRRIDGGAARHTDARDPAADGETTKGNQPTPRIANPVSSPCISTPRHSTGTPDAPAMTASVEDANDDDSNKYVVFHARSFGTNA
jgi:hypothetical protein